MLEKLELQSRENRPIDIWLDLAQEAAQLSQCYAGVYQYIDHESVRDYVPYSWISLIQIKREYFNGMAHYHAATGVLHKEAAHMSPTTKDILQFLHSETSTTQLNIRIPKDDAERRLLGKSHLREALVLHEECQRLQRMCRELKTKQALTSVLRSAHRQALQAFTSNEKEDDFRDMLDPPDIQGTSGLQV